VELIVPIEDPAVRDDVLDAVERCLVDDTGAWDLGPDRQWVRRTPGAEPRSVQRELMLGHAARAAEMS
jgi:polyphosphate kinase